MIYFLTRKIVDTEVKIDTLIQKIHDCSISWLDTDTSMKGGGVKGVIWGNSSPLREMMLSFT